MVRGNYRMRVDKNFHEMVEELCQELGVTNAQATRMIYKELQKGKRRRTGVELRL